LVLQLTRLHFEANRGRILNLGLLLTSGAFNFAAASVGAVAGIFSSGSPQRFASSTSGLALENSEEQTRGSNVAEILYLVSRGRMNEAGALLNELEPAPASENLRTFDNPSFGRKVGKSPWFKMFMGR